MRPTRWAALCGGLLLFSAAGPAAASPPGATSADAAPAPPAATLRVYHRDVITLRAELGGATPATRVERAFERLRQLPASAVDLPLTALPFTLGDARGVQFELGDHLLFAALEGDVDAEASQSFDALVEQTRARIEELRAVWHQLNDRALLLRGVLRVVIATLLLGFLIWIVYRGSQIAVERMEKKRDVLAAVHAYVDWREFLARLALSVMQLVQWFVLLMLAQLWLRFSLGSFVATEPLARDLDSWLWQKLSWVAEGVLGSLPGLATVLIVLLVTRALADVLGYFFDAVQQRRLRVPLLHAETTSATRRIVTLVAWGVGLAVAYPHLPGASSEAFRGLSVFFGLMITLGSTGLVTQAMSGLVVIYARALRKGDFVEVNGVQGVVSEVSALATKIINLRNEEITIPNSVLISSPIHNYSKLAGAQGTLVTTKVTIGYDAPWRQVHALLIAAAQKTAGLRASPAPFVYQRALADFYVEYELFASIDKPLERVGILSRLHANIQDAFNEHGVQIMSPHFFAQPERAVVVPVEQWHAAPAQADPEGTARG